MITLFIEVIYHPHNGNRTSTAIHLGASAEKQNASVKRGICIPLHGKPWAPFRTRSDFEFAEVAVTQGFTAPTVKTLLNGYHGRWADHSKITLRDNDSLQESLSAARTFVTQVYLMICVMFLLLTSRAVQRWRSDT